MSVCDNTHVYAQQTQSISQSQAIAMARKRVGGRVLRVEKTSKSYRVKMLQQSGRVISVSVNRSTGKVENTKAAKKQEK